MIKKGALINNIAADLFKAVPNMAMLPKVQPEDLHQYIAKVRNFGNKAKWLVQIAGPIKEDGAIPKTMAKLTAPPGIGGKSAKMIKHFAKPGLGSCLGIKKSRVRRKRK